MTFLKKKQPHYLLSTYDIYQKGMTIRYASVRGLVITPYTSDVDQMTFTSILFTFCHINIWQTVEFWGGRL